jgi:endonuclease YncB( thermonuclease family)
VDNLSQDPIISKILKFWFFTEIVITIIGFGWFLSSRNSASGLFFMILLAVLLTLATSIYLITRYLSIPKVKEKRVCIGEQTRLMGERAKSIDAVNKVGRAIASLETAHLEEINWTLHRIQREYINQALKSAVIDDIRQTWLSGELKAKLKSINILTAQDIGTFILDIDGIHPDIAKALVDWKSSILSRLEATQPTRLTDEQIQAINQKFKRRWQNLNKTRHAHLNQLAKIELELKAIDRFVSQLGDVSLLNYFSMNLLGQLENHGIKKVGPALVLGLLGTGALIHVGFGLASGGIMLMAALPQPTVTPATTIALSILPSVSFTPSPTRTPVPTQTSTATSTSTPTITLVPSMTATPTIDLSFYESAGCLPRNTFLQQGIALRIEDGDTILVRLEDGNTYTVRYVGIDAPEAGRPYADEAASANSAIVLDQPVILISDVSDVDSYGRLLRYVIVDSQFVNLELVKSGLAQAQSYPPDTACAEELSSAQYGAKMALLGMWTATQTPEPKAPEVVIITVDKRAEYVDIQNIGINAVDLSGWNLVSERGHQECPLSGVIGAGEVLRVWSMNTQAGGFSCGYNSPIWNNSEDDPAVLYNPQGLEVSRK